MAEEPVPLEGLNQRQSLNAFVVSEAVDGKDLNGDGDATDDVVPLADRRTGQTQSIGGSGASGRATARLHQPPFSFPAVATENDIIAFLESEPTTNDPAPPHLASDENGNGDAFDFILRLFRLGGAELTASLPAPRAVDAAPPVNFRSIVLSNGRAFYRRPEAADVGQVTERPSVGPGGVPGDATPFFPLERSGSTPRRRAISLRPGRRGVSRSGSRRNFEPRHRPDYARRDPLRRWRRQPWRTVRRRQHRKRRRVRCRLPDRAGGQLQRPTIELHHADSDGNGDRDGHAQLHADSDAQLEPDADSNPGEHADRHHHRHLDDDYHSHPDHHRFPEPHADRDANGDRQRNRLGVRRRDRERRRTVR